MAEPKTDENVKDLNIYQKMLKATEKINKVAKNLKVEIGKTSSYKAVSEADVLEAVKPVEIELGIYSYPVKREIIDTQVLDIVKEYNGNRSEGKQLFMRLEVTYRFVNVHNPKEFVDITTYGDGVDSQDKAPGKAMTYADKYALLKAYKIQTGEDPDKEGSGELKGAKKEVTKATQKQLSTLKELYSVEDLQRALGIVKKEKLEDLTVYEASSLISKKSKNVFRPDTNAEECPLGI